MGMADIRTIAQTAWLNREFVFHDPIGLFPIVVERLRGTPARAKELVVGLTENELATRVNAKWSVKEHLGHLVDLQPLDEQRLKEFLNHAKVLSAADVENRTTEIAGHRSVPIAHIIKRLAAARQDLVRRLEILTEEEVERVAIHPRLQQPMRLLDWVHFMAEHDDHHLARARSVIAGFHNPRIRKEELV